MAETVKGGLYRRPDGTFHDCNGKDVPPAKVRQYFTMRKLEVPEKYAEKPKAAARKSTKKSDG